MAKRKKSWYQRWVDGKVKVDVWEERGRLYVGVVNPDTGTVYAEWWDEDAAQMFEDGFFEPGIVHRQLDQVANRKMAQSVVEYMDEMRFK